MIQDGAPLDINCLASPTTNISSRLLSWFCKSTLVIRVCVIFTGNDKIKRIQWNTINPIFASQVMPGRWKKNPNRTLGSGDEKNNRNWLAKMNKYLLNTYYTHLFKETNTCICMVIEFEKFHCNPKINKTSL